MRENMPYATSVSVTQPQRDTLTLDTNDAGGLRSRILEARERAAAATR